MRNRTFAAVCSAVLLAASLTTAVQAGPSFRERQKACTAEWDRLKAAGKTAGLRWPKFWSDCSARMKAKPG